MRLKNAIHASTYIRGYPMLTLYIADVERDAGMKKLSQEEAEKVLEDMKVKIEIPKAAVTQWERNTALDMAIEALKYSEVPNSSDCISRQAAIDAVIKRDANCGIDSAEVLKSLPSAQPEIIRCKDCKWWDKSEEGQFGYCMAMKHGYYSTNWEISIHRRYKGDFYCADGERRTYETD